MLGHRAAIESTHLLFQKHKLTPLMLQQTTSDWKVVCRMMGVCNSHASIDNHCVNEHGFYDRALATSLLIRVLCSAVSSSISPINQQTLYDRIRFSAATIRAGGGGHGFYSRPVSRAQTSPSAARPEPEAQHPQQQQQHQYPQQQPQQHQQQQYPPQQPHQAQQQYPQPHQPARALQFPAPAALRDLGIAQLRRPLNPTQRGTRRSGSVSRWLGPRRQVSPSMLTTWSTRRRRAQDSPSSPSPSSPWTRRATCNASIEEFQALANKNGEGLVAHPSVFLGSISVNINNSASQKEPVSRQERGHLQ